MLNKSFQFGRMLNSSAPIHANDLQSLLETGKTLALSPPPSLDKTIDILARLGKLWSDESNIFHKRILAHLENSGIVGSSIILFFNECAQFFSRPTLEQRWQAAIGNKLVCPVGLVLHIGATNTLVSGLDGLVDGLLSGNINFYKFSSADGGVPGIFLESLLDADVDQVLVTRLVAFCWKGGDKEIEILFKNSVDRIIVWGGMDAVMSWRADLGYTARILSHGPKYGIGVLTAAGLKDAQLESLCKNIVMDVSMWDQKACNNLQALFVESKISNQQFERFLDCLHASFQSVYADAPAMRSSDDYVDIINAREDIKAESILNGGVKLHCPKENSWTTAVWSQWKSGLIPSPLCRFLHILKYDDVTAILQGLKDEKYWMQTMGCCGSINESERLLSMAKLLGITRVCGFGNMVLSSPTQAHDGGYDLTQLVNIMAE
ncbi:acyl-CoA reductase [Undibacterium parvum]|nr:acyl-CoA reductase [Undibacterium parvum]